MKSRHHRRLSGAVRRLATGTTAALLLATTGMVVTAAPASAYLEPDIRTGCTEIVASVTDYSGPGTMTLTVDDEVVDTAELALSDTDPTAGYGGGVAWSHDGLDPHSWTLTVDVELEADDFSRSGTTEACEDTTELEVATGCGFLTVYVRDSFPAGNRVVTVIDGRTVGDTTIEDGYEDGHDLSFDEEHPWSVTITDPQGHLVADDSGVVESCAPPGNDGVHVESLCDYLVVKTSPTAFPNGFRLVITVDGAVVWDEDTTDDDGFTTSTEWGLSGDTAHDWQVVVTAADGTVHEESGTTTPCGTEPGSPAADAAGGHADSGTGTGTVLAATGTTAGAVALVAALLCGAGAVLILLRRRMRTV